VNANGLLKIFGLHLGTAPRGPNGRHWQGELLPRVSGLVRKPSNTNSTWPGQVSGLTDIVPCEVLAKQTKVLNHLLMR
jgi:hypothetical protein